MSSAIPTIGLISFTGRIGKHIYNTLLQAHQSGQAKLVILHRASSDISSVPSSVETRIIDLVKGDEEELQVATKGINVLINASAFDTTSLQPPLIRAIASSPDLEVFIPAEFGAPWKREDIETVSHIFTTYKTLDAAVEAGIRDKITLIENGGFADYVFLFNIASADVKENRVRYYKDSLSQPYYIATAMYLGTAIGQLALRPPTSIAGRTFQVWDHSPTGNDFVNAFTIAHNKATITHELTEEEYQAALLDLPVGYMGVSALRLWGTGSFGFTEDKRIKAEGIPVIEFEKLVKSYLDIPESAGH